MNKFKSLMFEIITILGILLLVLVAGLVDLRNGQSTVNFKEVQEMSVSIENDRKNIEKMSSELIKKNQELEQMKSNLGKLKSDNIEERNNSIIIYNKKLSEYRNSLEEYNTSLDRYNKRYNQFKVMGKKNESLIQWIKSIIGI